MAPIGKRKIIVFINFMVLVAFIKYIIFKDVWELKSLHYNIAFDFAAVFAAIVAMEWELIYAYKFEKLIGTITDNIPYPIYYKKCTGEYLYCNKAFENLVGLEKRKILGKKIDRFMKNSQLLDLQKLDDEIIKSPGIQVYEFKTDIFGGIQKDFILRKDVVYGRNNKIRGITGVFFDITEVKSISTKLVETEKIDKLRAEFFSNISHELRTPINVILSAVQLIEKEEILKNPSHFNILKQNSYRMLRLVNNLIDITKIEAGFYNLNIGNHNIVNVVEEVVMSIADYIKSNELKIIFDTNVEEKIIACDPEKIERIMMNLISNAVKFSPKQGKIKVNIYDNDDYVVIAVKDEGIGIDKDKLKTIFQRFVQGNDVIAIKKQGSGIGLALVKSLVEMHGGEVWADSKKGKGATFYIKLPNKTIEEEVHQEFEISSSDLKVELADI